MSKTHEELAELFGIIAWAETPELRTAAEDAIRAMLKPRTITTVEEADEGLRETAINKVRAGWPAHGSTNYQNRGYAEVPPVRDGGMTARLIDYAVETTLALLHDGGAA